MNLEEYKIKISNLSVNDEKMRDLYLRDIALGNIQGPITGCASIDKPWLKFYDKETILEELPQNTIYGYLVERNKEESNRIAIEYFGNKLTYAQLFEKIDSCAKSLKKLGVKKGDIVTVCMPTTPEMVYIFYALSKLGAVSNMIDPRKSQKEIEEYTKEVNSKIFIGVNVIDNKMKDLKTNIGIKHVISVTPYESFNPIVSKVLKFKDMLKRDIKENYDDYLNWKEFINLGKNEKTVESVEYEANMPVTIVHTGGTTGNSKGVILSNDNINKCARQCEICGLDFSDRGTWLDIMPPFIVYGVGNGLHLPLTMGMKVILMPSFDPKKYDEILLKHKPNYMAGVPSHYGYLLESKKLKDVDLSFIKTPIVGGDKMDYNLERQVNEFFRNHNCKTKIIKGYGMSEVDAAVSVCATNESNKLKSVGIPLSQTNIGIFDPETNEELGYGEKGEVRITGPNTMLGYYNNEDEQNKVLYKINGKDWIYSGDLGYFDKDGCLFVLGRYKEMIIRPDGFKVYPNAIEDVIMLHDDVSECKVVGCRDFNESQGELPKAFIILKEDVSNKSNETILKEIKELCKNNLAEYSLPFDYEIREKLPLTSIGKINTIALKEEYEAQNKPKLLKK